MPQQAQRSGSTSFPPSLLGRKSQKQPDLPPLPSAPHQRADKVMSLLQQAAKKPGGPPGNNARVEFMKRVADHCSLDYGHVEKFVNMIHAGAGVGVREQVNRIYLPLS